MNFKNQRKDVSDSFLSKSSFTNPGNSQDSRECDEITLIPLYHLYLLTYIESFILSKMYVLYF